MKVVCSIICIITLVICIILFMIGSSMLLDELFILNKVIASGICLSGIGFIGIILTFFVLKELFND